MFEPRTSCLLKAAHGSEPTSLTAPHLLRALSRAADAKHGLETLKKCRWWQPSLCLQNLLQPVLHTGRGGSGLPNADAQVRARRVTCAATQGGDDAETRGAIGTSRLGVGGSKMQA